MSEQEYTSNEARRYVEVPYEHLERRDQGLVLTLAGGRRIGFLHTEVYHHDPEREVIGVPFWAAQKRSLTR